jgi:D-alanine-D-alanine ligase
MKIGLTYDLREEYLKAGLTMEQTAELDKPETIDALAIALEELGFEVERIGNAGNLVQALSNNKKWDLVFNICEGIYGPGRESLVPCLLDYYRVPFVFSDPAVLAISLHKGFCKRVVRDLGLPTGWFQTIKSLTELMNIPVRFPAFVKPVSEGTGKGISQKSMVTCQQELQSLCAELFTRFNQPLIVEEFLPGKEVTVGIVGSGAQAAEIGVMEVIFHQENIYSYSVKENYEEEVEYGLVSGEIRDQAIDLALKIWRGLGCLDGGRVDLRQDKQGRMTFIEVNPLAGLNPIHSDLPILGRLAGWSFKRLIAVIIMSALSRHGFEIPEKIRINSLESAN